MSLYTIIKTFICTTSSKIDTYVQDFFDYGLMSKCPNCNSRTILSYPTTVCTKCKNRFKNDITVVDVYTSYEYNYYGIRNTKYGDGTHHAKYGKAAFDQRVQQLNQEIKKLS